MKRIYVGLCLLLGMSTEAGIYLHVYFSDVDFRSRYGRHAELPGTEIH